MSVEQALGLSILLPLLGAIGVLLTGKSPNLRESVTLIVSLITCGLVLSIVPAVKVANSGIVTASSISGFTAGEQTYEAVWLAFEVEPLACSMRWWLPFFGYPLRSTPSGICEVITRTIKHAFSHVLPWRFSLP